MIERVSLQVPEQGEKMQKGKQPATQEQAGLALLLFDLRGAANAVEGMIGRVSKMLLKRLPFAPATISLPTAKDDEGTVTRKAQNVQANLPSTNTLDPEARAKLFSLFTRIAVGDLTYHVTDPDTSEPMPVPGDKEAGLLAVRRFITLLSPLVFGISGDGDKVADIAAVGPQVTAIGEASQARHRAAQEAVLLQLAAIAAGEAAADSKVSDPRFLAITANANGNVDLAWLLDHCRDYLDTLEGAGQQAQGTDTVI
jgi:hypothetical protein